jgi:NTP pyrophosphatase (non-canonical NTP hydrolase)
MELVRRVLQRAVSTNCCVFVHFGDWKMKITKEMVRSDGQHDTGVPACTEPPQIMLTEQDIGRRVVRRDGVLGVVVQWDGTDDYPVRVEWDKPKQFTWHTSTGVQFDACGNPALAYFDIVRCIKHAEEIVDPPKTVVFDPELVIRWAEERNLIEGSTPAAQALKLVSEVGELCDNIAKGRDTKDDLGDILVVLTILCKQTGTSIDEVFDVAWNDIKDRKGRMVNGVFVKESDNG